MNPERRARYLEVAQELFARHGFVGTSMDMIVAQAGGSKATLYRYFPSKDDLIAGLMDDVVATIGRQVPSKALDDLPLEVALTGIGRAMLDGVLSPRAITLFRLSLAEYGRFPQLARVVWEHGPARTYATFHGFLSDRQARGEVLVDDLQLASEHFIAGIVGHIQTKVAMGMAERPSPEEAERRVAAAVAAFLARYSTC